MTSIDRLYQMACLFRMGRSSCILVHLRPWSHRDKLFHLLAHALIEVRRSYCCANHCCIGLTFKFKHGSCTRSATLACIGFLLELVTLLSSSRRLCLIVQQNSSCLRRCKISAHICFGHLLHFIWIIHAHCCNR